MPIVSFTNTDYTFLDEQVLKADLILVDLDGVIITPKQYLGSAYWYTNYIKANRALIDSGLMSYTEIVRILYQCMEKTVFVAVDQGLISKLTAYSLIKDVIGLTGRVFSFRDNTERSLGLVGMRFTNFDFEVAFKNNFIFNNGVVYGGHDPTTGLPWNKGDVLSAFLEKYSKNVRSILFIDDSMKNLLDVENYCKERNLEFIGIEYTKIITSYNNKGMSPEVLNLIGEFQFSQLFNSKQVVNVATDQEVYDTLNAGNRLCGIEIDISENVLKK